MISQYYAQRCCGGHDPLRIGVIPAVPSSTSRMIGGGASAIANIPSAGSRGSSKRF